MHRLILLSTLMISMVFAQGPPPGGGPGGGSGDGIWVRNAAYGEIETFDPCNGHQPPTGTYHHHINPVCLRAQLNDNLTAVSTGRLGTVYTEKTVGLKHSPILGWAFDGYPVYGPYGYSNAADSSSSVRRLVSGFRLRTMADRHTLPAWFVPYVTSATQNLTAVQYGPSISAAYPLGRYVPDYDFVAGLGDLDQYNGRFAVTPEYPAGTYAYFVTVNSDGTPAFPYIFNVQIYGSRNGGSAQTVASDAADYFSGGSLKQTASTDPQLANWYTKGSLQNAQAVSGFDPSAGASTTWPNTKPAGVTVNGGNASAALADIQRVRANAGDVYVNANNLPSYVIGPWFGSFDVGGVFSNWASSTSVQYRVTRSPAVAATKASSGLGAAGVWVNGVAIFNNLDGGSYSNSSGSDQGGGGVAARTVQVSTASGEPGPVSPGALVSAYPEFDAVLATSTASAAVPAAGSNWTTSLGGATVSLTDSSGAVLPAGILYASPTQVNYRIPTSAASGVGKVTVTAAGVSVSGTVNVVAAYPGVFKIGSDNLAAAYVQRVGGSVQTVENVYLAGINGQISPATLALGTDQVYLILYGSGVGAAPVSATIGGINATVQYSGAQGTYPGLDQVNLLIPASLAGKGRVDIVLNVGGKGSNPVYIVVQ